jgi:hypothetical protein
VSKIVNYSPVIFSSVPSKRLMKTFPDGMPTVSARFFTLMESRQRAHTPAPMAVDQVFSSLSFLPPSSNIPLKDVAAYMAVNSAGKEAPK